MGGEKKRETPGEIMEKLESFPECWKFEIF